MNKRKIEIFSAGCALCEDTIKLVNGLACSSCEVTVHDMQSSNGQARAKSLGVTAVPAVAVNDELIGCGLDQNALESAGIGKPL